MCAFVRSFIHLLVRGIKNGHLIGQRNDVTANMAALAVYVPHSQPSLRHTTLLSLGLLGTTHTCAEVNCYCLVRGNALAIGTWVFLFRYLGTLAVSVLDC